MTKEAREICSDFIARAVVGSLFALLSINLVADFARTHRATGLLLLVSEALVVVLTIVRRRARLVDRSPEAAIATAISLVGPSLVRVSGASDFPASTSQSTLGRFEASSTDSCTQASSRSGDLLMFTRTHPNRMMSGA